MKVFLLTLLTTTLSVANAQTIIRGFVHDKKNDPVAMANVFLKDSYDGTSVDDTGKFAFTSSEHGDHTIVVRFIGYKEVSVKVQLNGKALDLDVTMEEEINELNAVTISAGSFTASDESRRTVFRAVDIATTAGATADIAGALNTLPGTQKVGESGRLFVRGGDGNEAKTFIDGMLVLDAYSPSAPNTPSRGRFLPFMFKGTSFSTGGYSAEFGQALSSTLALESRDESEQTRTDIGVLSVGGDVAHTQAWNRGSASAKIQYTDLRPYTSLISQRIDWKRAPASLEGVGAIRQRVGKNGMFKAYGNFNQANYALYNHDIDDHSKKQLYELANNYKYINTSYKDVLNENWIVRGGLAYTSIQNQTDLDKIKIKELERGVHAKVVFDGSLTDRIDLKTGAEVITRDYSYHIASGDAQVSANDFSESVVAAFAEADLFASNKFVTRLGARTEHNTLQNTTRIDPRLSLAYKTGENGQVSLAYGNFRQSAKNMWLRENPGLASEQASHFIANYQFVANKKTFRIETYYKQYNNLVKFMDGGSNNNGSGYAQGFELFWRDNESVKRLDYWISYSYLDTKRDYLNFPQRTTPSFASRHNFSIVGKYFIEDIRSQLGATFSYASGRPYNNPNQKTFNGSLTPSYQDLSFNWSYLPTPYLIVYFSCTNLLGRNNVFGYEYSTTQNEAGVFNSRPIRQAAPRFVFLGIFLTLSKDKSVNQLPTL